MDEIGFKVTRIASDGELHVESLGGGASDLFAWRPIAVHGTKGTVMGIQTRYGYVDVGATTSEEAVALGIEAGTKLTVPKMYRQLLGRRATVRSFDDRVGCAALIAALREIDPNSFAGGPAVWIVYSVEEEVGLRGAGAIAEANDVRRVYPIDSFVTSDSPVESKRFANARLGEGFVFRAIDNSGITPREVIEEVAALASAEKIPFQFGVTAGGNDGSRFVRYGAVNVPLSWPMRYSHSPGEVIDLRDAEALTAIVRALIEKELGGS
jgi:putative aminopeptidase FrvX